jgi:energy-coupling factor transport system ATP-binding protein
MAAVVFKNYSYAYAKHCKVLDGVTLTIEKGSFTVITGPSGAGKTTLCLAIAGIVPHYYGGSLAGEVFVNDKKTVASSMSELAGQVGTLLEDYESQLLTMTVAEEVAFSLENQGLLREEIASRVKESLQLVGLSGLEQQEVACLSGGQKQRLVIAAVLATRPDILVLDEPASAIDPEGVQEIYKLLGELNQKYHITVIVVEHDLTRVLPYAQQIVLLQQGKVVTQGTCEKVIKDMWEQTEFKEAVPALLDIKMTLESELGVTFTKWFDEETAIEELRKYAIQIRRGVGKSA